MGADQQPGVFVQPVILNQTSFERVLGMAFDIEFTEPAANHVRSFRKFDQKIILAGVDEQLRHEPTKETKHRKRLGPNDLATWELRIGDFRVFYDVETLKSREVVKVKAVGWKVHDKLTVGGEEVQL